MSARRSGKPHLSTWPLVLLAVPLLYLLSVPPVATYVVGRTVEQGHPVPVWLAYCMQPYRIVRDNTPVGGMLLDYEHWCFRQVMLFP